MRQSLSMIPIWVAGLLLAVSLNMGAQAEEQQSLEDLVAILQNVAQTPSNVETSQEDARNFEMLRRGMPQLNAYLQRSDFVNARRIVRTWMRQTRSDALQKLCQAVIGHLDKRLDETETPLLDQADDLIERARQVCRAATTSAEIDPIIEALYEFRNFELGHNQSRSLQRARQRLDSAARFVETYQLYLDALENEERLLAQNYLSQLTQSFQFRLLTSSELNERRNELERQIFEDATKKLDQIAAAIRTASNLTDLQNLQAQLEEVYQLIQNSRSLYGLQMRVSRARTSLQTWMAMLMAEAEGDVRTALEHLRQIQEASYRDANLFPAEMIVARHDALLKKLNDEGSPQDAEVARLLASIRQPSDFAPVRERVDMLRMTALSATTRRDFDALVMDLDRLIALHQLVDAGRIDPVWTGTNALDSWQRHRWSDAIMRLRDDVTRRAIAVSAGLDKFEQRDANETLAAGTLRLADEAAAAGDWQRVYRLLDVYAVAFARQVRPAWLNAELTACQAYLAGLQLEQFGQREKAAESYVLVLQQVGKRIPRKEAAERLQALTNK